MLTPKSFGKTITAEEMPSGMVRFFPSPKDNVPSLVLPATPPSSSTASETPIATSTAATATLLADSIETDSPALPIATYSNHTIPPKTMLRVLALVDKQLSDLESVLSILEMRFVGASVLIVYEGDLARLEDALENWESKIHEEDALKVEPEPDSDEEDEMYESESEDSDGSGDLDGAKEDAKMAKKCPPVVVKMIDFAHTWIAEGQGVDEGVLKGLRTLRGLVQGRSKELEALVM
jgi:1D-myo-inositol-tetrakisphosphate 5-kinase/inositol-polyphosphate multikinase